MFQTPDLQVLKVVPAGSGNPIDLTGGTKRATEATIQAWIEGQNEDRISTGLSWWNTTNLTNAMGRWARVKVQLFPHSCLTMSFA